MKLASSKPNRGPMIGMLLATAIFAGIAGACGYFVQSLLTNNQTQPENALGIGYFVLPPAIAAAIVTPCVWWLIVIRRDRTGRGSGACAGAVSVLFTYPVFVLLTMPALPPELRQPSSWMFMLAMAGGATGWFTLPIGACVGMILGRVQRRLIEERTSTPFADVSAE